MAAVLVLVGLFVAMLPGLLRPLGRRADPAEWAQLGFLAITGSVVMVEAGLILLAAPTVFRALDLGFLADACARVVGPLMPFGDTGGWAAAGLAVGTPALAVHRWVKARRRLIGLSIEPCLGRHEQRPDHDLVVLPSDAHIAYSVDMGKPQVVLSQGLIDSLDHSQLDAVVAHELAHLREDHPRMLLVAASAGAALAWWPPMRRSHRVFRASIERWADECAVGAHGPTRRSLCEALRTVTAAARPLPIATFSLAEATAERIHAMQARPEATWTVRAALYLPGAMAGVVTLAAIGVWLSDTQSILAMAGRCPI